MNFTELINWLLENGGPIIGYKTVTELAKDPTNYNIEKLRSDLLESEIVQKWLHLKNFPGPTNFYGLHHSKSFVYENLMNKLIQLGLNSTFRSYDDLAQKSLEILGSLMSKHNDLFRHFAIALILSFLCRSGYEKEELVRQALEIRFDALDDFTQVKNLDIYVDPAEFSRLPQSRRHDIVNPELYKDGKLRFPFIHDIWSFSGILKSKSYQNKAELIQSIIELILTEDYQNLKRGYGIVVSSPTKAYSMGWSVHLPFFHNPDKLDLSEASLKKIRGSIASLFLQRLYLMSQFPSARKSDWFTTCLEKLESYKTVKGTYLLPKSCLIERPSGYWVLGAYMGLGENRRVKNWREIESTFWMAKIKKPSEHSYCRTK
ncbi:hypothetical protein LCGC14_1806940 [marine sediment metagenome]|uniref:Uncharacterized protein n=1 Tax=marine sediment metagenome TaxID=412755 RepID=A0A0F9GN24_9ZZZZ